MLKKYYLAYGSNLNLIQMHYRCSNAIKVGKFNLNGYRLVFKGRCDGFAYLTIEKCEDSFVPLGIFQVSYFDVCSLDAYEGYPDIYSKKYFEVEINGQKQKALIYIMNNFFDYHIPSTEYIDTCVQGYKDFGFDKSILYKALADTIENLPIIKEYKKS